jgi:hypothetical protein
MPKKFTKEEVNLSDVSKTDLSSILKTDLEY